MKLLLDHYRYAKPGVVEARHSTLQNANLSRKRRRIVKHEFLGGASKVSPSSSHILNLELNS
eukprot:1368527-Rhodomonas_salina.1